MLITDTHVYFWGGTFSNWHKCKMYDPWRGNEFKSSEQGYMWYKADFFGDQDTAELILKVSNPREAKQLGKQVKGFDQADWDKKKLKYMIHVNWLKYDQNEGPRKELINTGNRILVEASPIDKIWGVGLAEDDPLILDEKNWLGENLLGKSLMEVRNYIQSKISQNVIKIVNS